jgi:hypothetical protein
MSKSQKEIFLHYKGAILYDTIGELISELKEKMFERHVKQVVYKKVLMVMIEALENVFKYHDNFENEEHLFNKYPPEIIISLLTDFFEIRVSNPIRKSDAVILKKRLVETNALDKFEIKQKYKEIITNGQFSEKGGAGLGIVEMAKISDGMLVFDFSKIDEKFDYYRLTLKIGRI